MPWLLAGCLVPDPEKFREPRSSAPVVIDSQVEPSITKWIDVPPFTRPFTIPYHSEDAAGDAPAAYLYLDFGTSQQQLLGYDTLQKASSFDTRREFRIQANINAPTCVRSPDDGAGCCHQARLLATHESKLVQKEGGIPEPDLTRAGSDLATVVWFLRVAPAGKTPLLLDDCTTVTSTP